ncbi:MAG: branched-chain amino acid ABC transporter substrate-binding protein, partial [Atribacterota bacterium]
MKRINFLLVISVLVLTLGLASLGVMAAPPVVIGLQAPITGSSAVEGEMAKQSVEIAAQMINE